MKKVYLLLILCFASVASFAQTTFSYAGATEQTYVVPAGVSALSIDAIGGAGGDPYYQCGNGVTHSNGGRVQCNLAVTPGEVLYIYVGGKGGDDACSGAGGAMVLGGFNGGMNSQFYGGASGGATDIRLSSCTISGTQVIPYTATNRIVVAGGGGGGADWYGTGGGGGGTVGGTGFVGTSGGTAGDGGTQTGPGPTGLNFGVFGVGGAAATYGPGGGGYWGGNSGIGVSGGGGGGSSYTDPVLCTSVTHTQGYSGANSDGYVIICIIPVAGTISGANNVCAGSTITLTDIGGSLGGTWSSSDGTIATVDPSSGVVTGVAPGNVTITYSVSGCSSTAITTAAVAVNPLPTLTLGAMPQVCAGVTSADIPFSAATGIITATTTLSYTGSVQTWVVPMGVTSINVDAQGAAGGLNSNEGLVPDRGGYGARIQATLAVTPGQVLNIYVGGTGSDGTNGAGGPGGYNGGGSGKFNSVISSFSGGGGGGGTDIRIGGIALTDRLIVAGGGGGAGLDCPTTDNDRGGDGGGLSGEDGSSCFGGNGFGGTQIAGGGGGICGSCIGSNGIPGVLGLGGDAGSGSSGGGGGGGSYGGGGGQFGGGGGGSSYSDPVLATSVTHTRGFNTGAGAVTITYSIPTTYDISWDPGAIGAGFADVTSGSVSASPITVAVPVLSPAAVYTGSLTVTNGITGCTSNGYAVSVTVKPIPDVAPVSVAPICNGASSGLISFTGSLIGTTFNWANGNPGIGTLASSSGDISSFAAVNAGTTPVTAVFTVTPTLNGCAGTPGNFTVTVNPTPDVNPSVNQTLCNNTMTSAIIFSGDVTGTTFSWTNAGPGIGLAPSGSGDTITAFMATDATTAPLTDTITVSPSANGCAGGSNTFEIIVNPTPVLTSLLNAAPVCDNTPFTYTSTSATIGTTYSWSRPGTTGISNPANSGIGNISETLHDSTVNPVTVTYVDTLMANGCVNTQNVTVVVNPTPMLTSLLTPPAICDSTMFVYASTSATSGTTYTWSRALVSGISNPAGSGMDTIMEVLVNTTPNLDTVIYMDTLMANGCVNIQSVSVVVNPRPMLTTLLTPPAICDSTTFTYVPASATTGTTFTWSRGTVTGISNPAASGGDTIMETLYNTSVNPVTVIYVDTLKANGCTNTQLISVAVNPTPVLSSSVTPPGLCDSAVFNYTPMTATVGPAFAWERPFVVGIGLAAGTGSDNPNEHLYNNTNDNLTVVYIYTITANGCSHTEDVSVVVHPTPTLSSNLTPSVCSGADVDYNPTSYVFGTTFTWSRTGVTGLTPATRSGTGVVHDTLTDALLTPLTSVYVFTLTANGCPHIEDVVLTVNPAPPVLPITTHSPSSVCDNTLNQNFGTNVIPPASQDYHWSATDATVWATGAGRQYCLVNFNTPGVTAVVTLKSNVSGYTCITNSSFPVTVGSSASDMPQVIYFQGQFICLQPDEDNYQWGYDDATTLDSTLITGENNPNYINPGADLTHRYYWVITNKGGCMQKTYYNVPSGITNVNTGDVADVKVFPNPANSVLNVEINTTLGGNYELQVVNMLGQQLSKTVAEDHKARIDVAALPAGCYLVDCYRDNVKIAAVRFIKN